MTNKERPDAFQRAVEGTLRCRHPLSSARIRAAALPSGASSHSEEETVVLRKLTLVLAVLAVPAVTAAGPAEDNVATTLRFYEEAVNSGHFELFDDFLAEDFVEHEDLPGFPPTREGVKQWFTLLRTAFPDLKFDVEFTMADGDKVAAYLTISGTQAAEFLGVPSQGHAFRVKTVDIIGFKNGKAVEHWGVTDTGAMMQQLTGEGAEAK